jgi:DNA-binding NarL/FixJ family response regulator
MILEATTSNRLSDDGGSRDARAIRVLVVAHYASVRAGLHAILAGQPGIAVVGDVPGSAELDTVLSNSDINVVVYDHFEEDGSRLLSSVAGNVSGIVVLGEETALLRDLAETPFNGWAYLNKETGGEELVAAVRAVAAGLMVIDHTALSALSFQARSLLDSGLESREETTLTAREMEVLKLMASGLPNKTIAAQLRISSHTAKFHVASILAKLGAASRTEAVAVGVRKGLLAL